MDLTRSYRPITPEALSASLPESQTPAELQRELGERIKALRVQRGFRQRDVVSKAGIGMRAMVRLETGHGSTVESLLRVLNALGIAGQSLEALAPRPSISPLAIARHRQFPRRVRRSQSEPAIPPAP